MIAPIRKSCSDPKPKVLISIFVFAVSKKARFSTDSWCSTCCWYVFLFKWASQCLPFHESPWKKSDFSSFQILLPSLHQVRRGKLVRIFLMFLMLQFHFTLFSLFCRTTPSLAIMILVYATWYIKIGDGPLWNRTVAPWKQFCVENWWSTLLYINNYYNPITQVGTLTWFFLRKTVSNSKVTTGHLSFFTHDTTLVCAHRR